MFFKLGNFGRLDPALQARGVKGLSHGAKGEVEIWESFADNPEQLAYESELLMAQMEARPVIEDSSLAEDTLAVGLDREASVKLRVNQNFFRKRVLAAYDNRCCVTGIETSELLIASHIIPWSEDVPNRLNLRNGLCLNALHDKAFDRGLMWIDPDLSIRLSGRLHADASGHDSSGMRWLLGFEGQRLRLTKKFSPDMDLLDRHATKARMLS